MRSDELDSQQIKEAGLKITRPRQKILDILERSERRHLSAEDVYKALLDTDDSVGDDVADKTVPEAGTTSARDVASGMEETVVRSQPPPPVIACTAPI